MIIINGNPKIFILNFVKNIFIKWKYIFIGK